MHLSYRKRRAGMDGYPQRGSGGDNGVFRRVFVEVLQGREGARHLLHLVEHDEGVCWLDGHSRFEGQGGDKARRGDIPREEPGHALVAFEGDVGERLELGAPELFDEPGLAHLPCPGEEQGFS